MSGWKTYRPLAFLAAVAVCSKPAVALAERPAYRLTEIGAQGSYVTGVMNDAAQITGSITEEGTTHTEAFFWDDSVLTRLGTLGGSFSSGIAVNEAGQVVGYSSTLGDLSTRTFLWDGGEIEDIGTLGGNSTHPSALNNLGHITGFSDLPGDEGHRPFLWNGESMIDLGSLGGLYGGGNSLNDQDQVVGGSDAADGTVRPFLWEDGFMREIAFISQGVPSSTQGINSSGQIIGNHFTAVGTFGWFWDGNEAQTFPVSYSTVKLSDAGQVIGQYQDELGRERAFLWEAGQFIDLGAFEDQTQWYKPGRSRVTDLNESGQVIGTSLVDSVWRPFLWQEGFLMKLGDLIDPPDLLLGHVEIEYVQDINNRGDIIGIGRDERSGKYGVYLLKQMPYHASMALSPPAPMNVARLAVALRDSDSGRYYSQLLDESDGSEIRNIPLTPESLRGHAFVNDLNDNGAAEVASLEISLQGWVEVKVKDGLTGDLIVKMPFEADYYPVWMRIVPDMGLGGSVGLAVLGINSEGRTRVQVRDALTGNLVSKVYFETSYVPFGFEVVEDLDGSTFPELAVLGVDAEGRVRAQVKDVISGRRVSMVYFDKRYTPSHTTGVDMDGDGLADALAVLGENAEGIVRAQVKDAATASPLGLVRFESGYTSHTLVSVPDVNLSGSPELAVLQTSPEGAVRVQVKDAVTGQAVSVIGFTGEHEPRDLVVVPDVNGNQHSELAYLGEGPVGSYVLQVKDVATGQVLLNRTIQ